MTQERRTQWAAQFAVAAELCKRGYDVSFTMGNSTPVADLMLVSPILKQMFLVDVKGLYCKNVWIVKRKPIRQDLYYVLALVPVDAAARFFLVRQQDMNAHIAEELKRLGRPDEYRVTGMLFSASEKHENKWNILPQ